MTDTDLTTPDTQKRGLASMLLPELRGVAGDLGIKGISGMRKGELIEAIRSQQSGGASRKQAAQAPAEQNAPADAAQSDDRGERRQRDRGEQRRTEPSDGNGEAKTGEAKNGDTKNGETKRRSDSAEGNEQRSKNDGQQKNQNNGQNNNGPKNNNNDDDGEGGGRRGRRRRERRRGNRGDRNNDAEPQLNEGDAVAPVAGILDVLDNYAFVRTSGYLAGPNDVYVSMNMVRRYGLRRGDAITGAVKVPREGENSGGGNQSNRQKFNPMVRLDTVNGMDPETAKKRPEFSKLTPLYPNQRLRLETTPERLDTRVIDLIMPIGKGQRALIVSPPKAGKTTILQDIANAIATNNPECHLMVVLVDERPEEVTDMQRSVKGEVIASTFDRPPSDHTSVSELAIERAKRLVEQGKDVVVLLDSITRLGRAYNNASPASGRILSGGVDSTALYPPKRFLGAARNIENGGSLTIIASALVETGSTGDTVIFEEFKGTGNAELKLDRKIAERRVFPAVDVNLSSTRKDELLLSPDEFAIVHKLRRLLSGLDSQAAIDLLIAQLKKTKTNVEFLMQVQSNAPGALPEND
ncbi:MAG: transcription termination factor Rho [Gordonia sp. (in: high G+C Gram-positive bacteria)]|uniref:transcription termination factor Rho n=1 Tax=Gordonia sp. (in: high G+C Gram-positive bacteria) TaxID=84139 RepID=UPI0039E5105C